MTIYPRIVIFPALLLFGACGPAQQAAPTPVLSPLGSPVSMPEASPGKFASESKGRVYLDLVVQSKAGEPLTGLQQQDFTVLDNRVSQPIASFAARSAPDAAVEVVLVLDAANADYQTVAFARKELKKFLLSGGGELAYPATLALLTDKGVEIQQGSSRDGKALSKSLDKYDVALHSITRSTGFYGAEERLQLSLTGLRQLTQYESTKPGRKVMLWISPGWPLLSGPRVDLSTREEQQIYEEIVSLSTQLRRARVTVYSVDPLGTSENISQTQYYKQFVKGVSRPSQAQVGDLGLQVLAVQTGGMALTSSNDLAGLVNRAVEDAKTFYEISFDLPMDRPGEYHQLEVQVTKPGMFVRTRQGYYSQP